MNNLMHYSQIDVYSGAYFYLNNPILMRWRPYKPVSQHFKKGIKGRFQKYNGWSWENTNLKPDIELEKL